MGDRLGILRVVGADFPCHCPILLQNIEFIEKYILSSTHVHDHTVWKIPVLVRSPKLN